jgi:hypothetical protein
MPIAEVTVCSQQFDGISEDVSVPATEPLPSACTIYKKAIDIDWGRTL